MHTDYNYKTSTHNPQTWVVLQKEMKNSCSLKLPISIFPMPTAPVLVILCVIITIIQMPFYGDIRDIEAGRGFDKSPYSQTEGFER